MKVRDLVKQLLHCDPDSSVSVLLNGKEQRDCICCIKVIINGQIQLEEASRPPDVFVSEYIVP